MVCGTSGNESAHSFHAAPNKSFESDGPDSMVLKVLCSLLLVWHSPPSLNSSVGSLCLKMRKLVLNGCIREYRERKVMKAKLLTFALVFASLGTIAVAQKQDRRLTYQPRKLSQIIEQESQRLADISAGTAELLNSDGLPSRVTVIYKGKSRKTDSTRKAFVSQWSEVMNVDITGLFEVDFLFVEDSVEYWIQVHKNLIPRFEKLKKGEKVDLLLLWIGARRKEGKG
jgi:hypothetical protein